MSDYGQNDYEEYAEAIDDYAEYDQQQMEVEEEIQTKVDLDFYEAEQLLRNGKTNECINSLEVLYKISEQNNLRNWKVKILNMLLQIYCKENDSAKIKATLESISDLNQKEKYPENVIKSIIVTIKSLPEESFNQNKRLVYGFLDQLDMAGKIRSYILFLEKAVQEKNRKEADKLFGTLNKLISDQAEVPAGSLIQIFSLQIRHSQNFNLCISQKIRRMELKIVNLQSEVYMSEGHISIIKQAIAELLYQEDNFQGCSAFICEAFQQKMKYGKNTNLQETLKINTIVSLLTNNPELSISDKYNALYHQSAFSFKSKNDVQALFGLIEAFNSCDINQFNRQIELIQPNFSTPYQSIVEQALLQLKKNKALEIIKPYQKVKLSYLQKRLNSSLDQVKQIVFDLITSQSINGRLRLNKENDSYLDIYPEKDEFLTVQLENIRELSKRYMGINQNLG